MLYHKTSSSSIPRPIQRLNEAATGRRALINQIDFTYRRLLRMLPAIIKRLDGGSVERILLAQDHMDGSIRDRLGHVAAANGLAPEPCNCDEAEAMVESVRYADRAARSPADRAVAVLAALTTVRAFLLGLWDKLLGTLSLAEHTELRKEAKALQEREAQLHRELIALVRQGDSPRETG